MTLALALRAALVLATALLLVRLPFAPRHRRDLATLASLLVLGLPLLVELPVLPWPTTAATAVAPSVVDHVTGHALQEPLEAAATGAASWALLLPLWALGALLVAARALVAHVRAYRLVATAHAPDAAWQAAADRAGVAVRAHGELDAPVVAGLLRPTVLVPAACDWPQPRRVRALRHERAHVDGRDPLRQALATAVTAVHWFDPLAWMAARAQRDALEAAADARAVADGADAIELAHDLVSVARQRRQPALVGWGSAPLDRRVRALLAGPRRAVPALRPVGAALLAGVALVGTLRPATAAPDALQPRVDAEVARLAAEWAADSVAIVIADATTGQPLAIGELAPGDATTPRAPGSVVKPFVAVTALASGQADLAHLTEALATSDNPTFVALATALGPDAVAATMNSRGLPAASGLAPDALALGGFPVGSTDLAAAWARLDDDASGQAVREALVQAVEGPRATGGAAAVPGVQVAGKTGSAPRPEGGLLASFVGYVPADAPRYVVLVQVGHDRADGWGGRVAAPAFARLADALR